MSHMKFLKVVFVVQFPSHVWLFEMPQAVACQAPPSMEFPRQEYWSKLPFPSPGDLPEQKKLESPALAGGFFTTEPPGNALLLKNANNRLNSQFMVVTSKIMNIRIDAFELWCGGLLRVPWTARWSNPVNPKGNQPWMYIGRADAEAQAPILCPPDAKNWLIGKDPGAGKDWIQEEKGTAEDQMDGWYHQLNGHKFEQGLGDSVGQRGLVCRSPWGCKELDTTEWLNNNNDNEKVWLLWELLKCDTETWSEKCWKNGSDRFTWQRVVTNFNFVKNTVSVKWNEARCVKRGTPARSITGCDILL